MQAKTVIAIFKRFKKANRHPTTELRYSNSFQLLVAVILSAQATDNAVNKATAALFTLVHTPEDIIHLGKAALTAHVKSIGLYQAKVKYILATAERLIMHYHSRVPHTRDALESLPGVGRKTANVILNTCFGEPVIAVDTHIFRVAQRIGLAKGKTPRAIEDQLTQIIPHAFLPDAHHWLILHGRYTCTARKPHCPTCIIRDLCAYPAKTVS